MSNFPRSTRTTILAVAVISAVAAFAFVASPSRAPSSEPARLPVAPAVATKIATAPAPAQETVEAAAQNRDCAKHVRIIYSGYGEGCPAERL